MEKVSKYYLTPDTRHSIYILPWQSETDYRARHIKEAALLYAETRKEILTDLANMQQEQGLAASLKRFQTILNLKTHGIVHKAFAWWTGNIDAILKTDSLVLSDVGKMGAH